MILTNDEALARSSIRASFRASGGPLMHVIAAKAVAFGELVTPGIPRYARNVVDNARTLLRR